MAFSIASKSMHRGSSRSHTTLHQATSRDYDRMKLAAKQELKHELDYDLLERKLISRAKWSQRAETNQVRLTKTSTPADRLDEYLQRQRSKQENSMKAKQLGNERIRRTSTSKA